VHGYHLPSAPTDCSGPRHDQRHFHFRRAHPVVPADVDVAALPRQPVLDGVILPHHQGVMSDPVKQTRMGLARPEPALFHQPVAGVEQYLCADSSLRT